MQIGSDEKEESEKNGVKSCGESPTIEESILQRAVMNAVQKIAADDGEFVDAFRQNVIRVIGNYGRKEKLAQSYEQRVAEMDTFLQNSTQGIPQFDDDLVRRLISNIKVISAESIVIQFKSGIIIEQKNVSDGHDREICSAKKQDS